MIELSELPILEYDDSHWPDVDAFWSVLLGAGWDARSRERWRWMNESRTHYFVRNDDRILGNATLLRQRFVGSDGAPIDLGWITDFYVSPELKGRGIGKRLTNHLTGQVELLATFGQSEAARHCFSRLGWTAPTWIPLVAKTLPSPISTRPQEYLVVQVDPDDPRISEVWTDMKPRRTSMGVRDADHLARRLKGRPDAKYETWLALTKGRPAGWIALRIICGNRNRMFGWVPVGLVVDVLAARDEAKTLEALVDFGTRRLARQGAVVVLAVQTTGVTGRVLRISGFRPSIGIGPLTFRSLPAKGFMMAPGGIKQLGGQVHLSFIDCDAELTF